MNKLRLYISRAGFTCLQNRIFTSSLQKIFLACYLYLDRLILTTTFEKVRSKVPGLDLQAKLSGL